MGDFNIDQLKPDSSACKYFKEHVLEPFDLSAIDLDAGKRTLIMKSSVQTMTDNIL